MQEEAEALGRKQISTILSTFSLHPNLCSALYLTKEFQILPYFPDYVNGTVGLAPAEEYAKSVSHRPALYEYLWNEKPLKKFRHHYYSDELWSNPI